MLHYLVRVCETSAGAAILLGLIVALGLRCPKSERRFISVGLLAGAIVAFICAFLKLDAAYAAKLYGLITDLTGVTFRERYMVREYYNLAVVWPTLIAIVLSVGVVVKSGLTGSSPARLGKTVLGVLLAGVAAGTLADLFLYPFEFAAGAETFYNTDVFLKVLGYLIGLLIVFLAGLSVTRVSAALSLRVFAAFLILALLAYGGLLCVDLSQALYARTRLLKDHAGTVIWLMSHAAWFVYFMIGVIIAMAAVLFGSVRLEPVRGGNPALVRKHKARVAALSRSSVMLVVLMVGLFTILTAVKTYAERPPQITAATPVEAVENGICVPLESVDDGKLHRFTFKASDGTDVRFLVIRKSASAYGVGLDACDICGSAGYYQRGDLVICNRCDVAMNIATIGFPGGCNPVPLSFSLQGGDLTIDPADLEKEKRRFR